MNWIASKIHMVPIGGIKEYENNPKTHSEHQIQALADMIREFGFTTPLLMRSDGSLVAGHGRLAAAKLVGHKKLPAIYIDHLSNRQIKALAIADNKVSSLSGWDMDKLASELSDLAAQDFDLGLTGFNEQELDALLRDEFSILPDTPPVQVAVSEPPRPPAEAERPPLPEGNFQDPGISYKSQFGVIVMCDDELQQAAVYERLTGEGLKCKVVVT